MSVMGAEMFATSRTLLKELTLADAQRYHRQLCQWENTLPPSTSLKLAVQPHELVLHMHYWSMVIALFEPFVTARNFELRACRSSAAGDFEAQSPETIILDARNALETVYRLYYFRHGFAEWDPMIVHITVFQGFLAIKILTALKEPPGDVPGDVIDGFRATLVLTLRSIRSQARSCHLAATISRLLRDAVDPDSSRILEEMAELSDDDDDEKKAMIAEHVKAQSPINVMSILDDPEDRRLDTLIAAYKTVGLSDVSDDDG